MKEISCIIPAYNEAKNIGHTLDVVVSLIGKYLCEVIVIDDFSSDLTKEIVKRFPMVVLIEHKVNEGKSKSVADGIKVSKGDYIFLLDADLIYLNEKNIIDLINPVAKTQADVSISYIKNAWPLFPFKKIDYLSGQRVMPKSCLFSNVEQVSSLPNYGLEVYINRIMIRNNMSIAVVQWNNVENNFNQHKYGWVKGIRVIAKIWWNVLSVVSIPEMYFQNIKLNRLIVD